MLTSERASIILEKVVDDASSILFSGQNESLISRVTSNTQDEYPMSTDVDLKDFSFDQEVLMTPAYRKVQISTRGKVHGSEVECIEIENPSVNATLGDTDGPSTHYPALQKPKAQEDSNHVKQIARGVVDLSSPNYLAKHLALSPLNKTETSTQDPLVYRYAPVEVTDISGSQSATSTLPEADTERKVSKETRGNLMSAYDKGHPA